MLDDCSIDMVLSPSPGVTMLLIQDFMPWSEPDSDERFEQFSAKLGAYTEYIASERFDRDHPSAIRTMVAISVITVTPPSARMKAITNTYTPGETAYEILVRFPKEAGALPVTAKKPWWKFW